MKYVLLKNDQDLLMKSAGISRRRCLVLSIVKGQSEYKFIKGPSAFMYFNGPVLEKPENVRN